MGLAALPSLPPAPPPRCEKAGASCRGKGGNGVRIDASLAACQQHCAYWSQIMDPCWTWGAMALLCLLMPGGELGCPPTALPGLGKGENWGRWDPASVAVGFRYMGLPASEAVEEAEGDLEDPKGGPRC